MEFTYDGMLSKKVGFKEEGVFRNFYFKDDDTRYNATPLALLASEYIEL